MKNNEFEMFTKKEYKFIPANVLIVKNMYGWMYLYNDKAQWYVNHTNDEKNCPKEENEKFLKKLMKAIKEQMKLV